MHIFFSHLLESLGTYAGIQLPIIAGAVWIWLRSTWAKRRRKLAPDEINNQSQAIRDRMNIVRDRVGAQRIYLSRVRNGKFYEDGNSVQYYDRTQESVEPGTAPELARWSSIPIATVPEELKLIAMPGPSFTHVKDIPDGQFKWMLSDSNIKCVARCSVMHGNRWWGILGADWTHDVDKPANIEEFVSLAGTIDQLMGTP